MLYIEPEWWTCRLVPRPLPPFQCCTFLATKRVTLKNWEWPGDEASVHVRAPYPHCTAYGGQLPAETMQLVDSKGTHVDYQRRREHANLYWARFTLRIVTWNMAHSTWQVLDKCLYNCQAIG